MLLPKSTYLKEGVPDLDPLWDCGVWINVQVGANMLKPTYSWAESCTSFVPALAGYNQQGYNQTAAIDPLYLSCQ